MTCDRFTGARVLDACGEDAGAAWERHAKRCGECGSDVADLRLVRRLYSGTRPLGLNDRRKRSIVSRIRRMRTHGRMRSALASLAGIAAMVAILAGVGGSPTEVAAAEPAPAGAAIDRGLAEIHARLTGFDAEPRTYFDAALDDLKARVGSITWDTESM